MEPTWEKLHKEVLSNWCRSGDLRECYGKFSKKPDPKKYKQAQIIEKHLWKALKATERMLGADWMAEYYKPEAKIEIKEDANEHT